MFPATGEWTKAVSKKDRKNRSKKDDGSRKDDFPAAAAAAAERTSPSHEIQKTVQVTHPTVNSRDEVCSNRTQRRVGFTFNAIGVCRFHIQFYFYVPLVRSFGTRVIFVGGSL